MIWKMQMLFGKVDIFEMLIRETPENHWINCSKCAEHHKFLAKELERLYHVYSLDPKQCK